MQWGRSAPADHRPLITAVLSFTSAQLSFDGRIETIRTEQPARLRELVMARVHELADEAGVPVRLALTDAHGQASLSIAPVSPSAAAPADSAAPDSAAPADGRSAPGARADRRRRLLPVLVTAGSLSIVVAVVGVVLVISQDQGDAAATVDTPAPLPASRRLPPAQSDLVELRELVIPVPRTVAQVSATGGANVLDLAITAARPATLEVTVVGPGDVVLMQRRLRVGPQGRTVALADLGAGEYRWRVVPERGPVREGTATVTAPEPVPTTEQVPTAPPDPVETPAEIPDAPADAGDDGSGGTGKRDHSDDEGSLIGGTGPIDPDA
ncbi:hypothetical protein [Nocardioides sambongensis]|uniref:hypothetical protein n=1 Tax=Nocardioides sambongensis TaxID=2589074 RepID=UPI00112B99A9|nr:hypothetical protein [Nocardioides sambongensis]